MLQINTNPVKRHSFINPAKGIQVNKIIMLLHNYTRIDEKIEKLTQAKIYQKEFFLIRSSRLAK